MSEELYQGAIQIRSEDGFIVGNYYFAPEEKEKFDSAVNKGEFLERKVVDSCWLSEPTHGMGFGPEFHQIDVEELERDLEKFRCPDDWVPPKKD